MAVFDYRLWLIFLFMWLCILGVVRELGMENILLVIVVVGLLALLAAVLVTEKPTDLRRTNRKVK